MHNTTQFEAVIGLEVHVRLGLQTKLFCPDENAYGREPNVLISEISLGYPGTMPVLNKEAITAAIKMGMACNSQLASEVVFDRKNYFYPDLPKGYQVTQDRKPICDGGFVDIISEAESFRVLLTKIHLEEDAGKSIHGEDGKSSIDYNRAGTALIEIVTDPVIQTADQAGSFVYEIRRLVRYLKIGNGNMEEGSLRCDANISIRPNGTQKLGNKVEIKNMNSISNVKKAIVHEIQRQTKRKLAGDTIVSETRSFDPATGATSSMREKETLTDYRYFPEPDLVPEILNDSWIQALRDHMPELGAEKERRFRDEFGLSEYEAELLTRENEIAIFFEQITSKCNPKSAANWMLGPVLSYLNENACSIDDYPLSTEQTMEIISLIETDAISFGYASKNIVPEWIHSPNKKIEEFLSDDSENLEDIIVEVLAECAEEVKLYKSGKKKLFGAIMGSLIRKSGRKADPKKMKDLLHKALDND